MGSAILSFPAVATLAAFATFLIPSREKKPYQFQSFYHLNSHILFGSNIFTSHSLFSFRKMSILNPKKPMHKTETKTIARKKPEI